MPNCGQAPFQFKDDLFLEDIALLNDAICARHCTDYQQSGTDDSLTDPEPSPFFQIPSKASNYPPSPAAGEHPVEEDKLVIAMSEWRLAR